MTIDAGDEAMLPDRLCQLLTAYVDGELTVRRARAVQRLLERTPEARELLAQLRANAERLRALDEPEARPHLARVNEMNGLREGLRGRRAIEQPQLPGHVLRERAHVGGDHAVDIGLDPPRISIIAVQHAVRYAGAFERFENTEQDQAWTRRILRVGVFSTAREITEQFLAVFDKPDVVGQAILIERLFG